MKSEKEDEKVNVNEMGVAIGVDNEVIEKVRSREFIRLIDGDEFIDMWLEFYDKMTDDDKNMLPLKRISFLGSNE